MNDKTINTLINSLNKGNFKGLIYTRNIDMTVEFAKLWMRKPHPNDKVNYTFGVSEPFNFYFIKTINGEYVGAIHDTKTDLHWYVSPKHRKKGLLSQALINCILPHLFLSREEQKITIDRDFLGSAGFTASVKVAERVGFTKTDEKEDEVSYVLQKKNYANNIYYEEVKERLSDERVDTLARQINYSARSLQVVQTELEMKIGSCDYTEDIKQLYSQINALILRLKGLPSVSV